MQELALWPVPFSEKILDEKTSVQVGIGVILFLTCYLNALVLTQSTFLGRATGTTLFLALEKPPLFRRLNIFSLWPLYALGASLPVFFVLSLLTDHFPTTFPNTFDLENMFLVPCTEELVFRLWWFDIARSASFPYPVALIINALAFGLWHGLTPQAIGFTFLSVYWAHSYVTTGNILIPISMHIYWNIFALANQATFTS